MKFSVIIPTMWKSEYTPELLDRLCECDYVGEVIIIDNNPYGFKADHWKIKVVTKGYNIYVNPSWNIGVELAKYENICLCNDDVLFNPSVFEFLSKQMGNGVYGISTENYYLNGDSIFTYNPIKSRCWGWGCVIFLKKKHYVSIPSDLLIACGDDFLISRLPAFEVKGLKVVTKISTTSFDPIYFPIQDNDLKLYKEKYAISTNDDL